LKKKSIKFLGEQWSGRRDSNPRHPPWQGGALPTELRPHMKSLCVISSNSSRKLFFKVFIK
jgi:hypothetical protein